MDHKPTRQSRRLKKMTPSTSPLTQRAARAARLNRQKDKLPHGPQAPPRTAGGTSVNMGTDHTHDDDTKQDEDKGIQHEDNEEYRNTHQKQLRQVSYDIRKIFIKKERKS